jgi:hypothetical protein
MRLGLGLAARIVGATALVGLGFVAILESWGPFRNVFEKYQDSTTETYIFFAAVYWAVALGAFVAAFLLVRSTRRLY